MSYDFKGLVREQPAVGRQLAELQALYAHYRLLMQLTRDLLTELHGILHELARAAPALGLDGLQYDVTEDSHSRPVLKLLGDEYELQAQETYLLDTAGIRLVRRSDGFVVGSLAINPGKLITVADNDSLQLKALDDGVAMRVIVFWLNQAAGLAAAKQSESK